MFYSSSAAAVYEVWIDLQHTQCQTDSWDWIGFIFCRELIKNKTEANFTENTQRNTEKHKPIWRMMVEQRILNVCSLQMSFHSFLILSHFLG